MRIPESDLSCRNCRYYQRRGFCSKKNQNVQAASAVCTQFFPDGICCKYCHFFRQHEIEGFVPTEDDVADFNEGYCVRANLNDRQKWYDYCESFDRVWVEKLFLLSGEKEEEQSPYRTDGTLKADLSDFPGLKERIRREKSGGCYIATAVYGSYEAPEVLILRRFRDKVLLNHGWGRVFVKIYYTLSPPVAKALGNARFINRLVRGMLDRIVSLVKDC